MKPLNSGYSLQYGLSLKKHQIDEDVLFGGGSLGYICASVIASQNDGELAQMVLDQDAVARYLKSRIPFSGTYTLMMDRTN